jgi:hypothetical protein
VEQQSAVGCRASDPFVQSSGCCGQAALLSAEGRKQRLGIGCGGSKMIEIEGATDGAEPLPTAAPFDEAARLER